jgi:HSP20 family molecular chaperone IbpA
MAVMTHAHPAVRAFETDDDFVVEVELPALGAPLQLDLQARSLTIRIPVPHQLHEWRANPDASGV